MLLNAHVTSVLYLVVWFSNLALTNWSCTLLLKSPFLCALDSYIHIYALVASSDTDGESLTLAIKVTEKGGKSLCPLPRGLATSKSDMRT